MQGLTGDKPRILRCQKHRGSGDFVRLRHAAERDRACHLDDFRFAAAIARLSCIREPGRNCVDPDAVRGELQRHRQVSDGTPPLLAIVHAPGGPQRRARGV